MKLHKEIWEEFDVNKQLIDALDSDETQWMVEKMGENNVPSVIRSHTDSFFDDCGFTITFGWLFLNVELKRYDPGNFALQHKLCKRNFFFLTEVSKKIRLIRKKMQQESEDALKGRIIENMPIDIIRSNNLDDLLD